MLATFMSRNSARYSLLVMTAGFALFAMFFGSGNLIFPVGIGVKAQQHFGLAIIGLTISGVILPFLGLLAVIKNDGDYYKLFSRLHPALALSIPLTLQLLMGPLGVIPRCINVAYGGLHIVAPDIPLWALSAFMCVVVWFCVQSTSRAIDSVGKILTPVLLLSLFIIVVAGIFSTHTPAITDIQPAEAFTLSVLEGYQTMDLLAAFFFATTVYTFFKGFVSDNESALMQKLTLKSCLIAGLLLSLTYAAFIYLGAVFAPMLSTIEPQNYLSRIAYVTLGSHGGQLVSVCIGLACLTTAIVLVRVFVDFIYKACPSIKISQQMLISITIVVSFLFSTLEFNTIASYLGFLMVIIYPGLVVLALTGLSNHPKWQRWTQPVVITAFILSAFTYFCGI